MRVGVRQRGRGWRPGWEEMPRVRRGGRVAMRPYNNADRVSEPNFAAWDSAVRAGRIGKRTCRDVS